ncbi:hypothetical protein ACT4VO_12610 [Acinetobacter baumannii]
MSNQEENNINLSFEQDNGAVWVFAGDSQFGTEISHLMMMHADEYSEDELRVICHHAACEIDRLRAELEKAKAQAVPEGYVVVPKEPTDKMLKRGNRLALSDSQYRYDAASIYEVMLEASESGAEG